MTCPKGSDARLYYEEAWTSGTDVPATPVWTMIPRLGDITMPLDGTEVGVNAREVDAQLVINGKTNWAIDTQFNHIKGQDAARSKLLDSKFNNTPLLIAYLDDESTVNGAKGFMLPMVVVAFGHDAPEDDRLSGALSFRATCGFDASGNLIAPAELSITIP